ncbi:Hypothetical predicted protein [Cloeon dipterum]|uniref:Uncharacterized protein n=1 Tax=Cloeon dipterum TaxID=197152 RepID=A0A8S1DZ76_9INSE|nr:Hypothetical predicted protein [Cloeon dipterum]
MSAMSEMPPNLRLTTLFNTETVMEKQIEAFQFANESVPMKAIYSPYFHTMKTYALRTGGVNCWGQAAHILIRYKTHGSWKNLEQQIRSTDATILCQQNISKERKRQMLMGSSYSNPDVANFLLDDLVMIELPFQPDLLHHWLAVAYNFVLDFERHMLKFYNIPVPVRFKPRLLKLHKLLVSTKKYVGYLFDYLQCQINDDGEIFVGNLRIFSKFEAKVVKFLTFWLRGDGEKSLKALPSLCWKKLDTVRYFQLNRERMSLDKRNFMYNLKFWAGPGKDLKLFGHSNEILVGELDRNLIYRKLRRSNFKYQLYLKMFGLNICKTDLTKVNNELSFSIFIYGHLDDECFEWLDLFEVNSKKHQNGMLSNSLSHRAQIEFLDKTYQQIQDFTNSPQHVFKFDSDMSEKEARIKKVVVDCIVQHYKIKNFAEQKNEILRDWQLLQCLIPCFAVSLLDLYNSKELYDNDIKDWYVRFIHELIFTYEGHGEGIRKSSMDNIMEDVRRNPELEESISDKNGTDNLRGGFDRIASHFLGKIAGLKVIHRKIEESGFFPALLEAMNPTSVRWNWMMWDFFRRFKLALDKSEIKS